MFTTTTTNTNFDNEVIRLEKFARNSCNELYERISAYFNLCEMYINIVPNKSLAYLRELEELLEEVYMPPN